MDRFDVLATIYAQFAPGEPELSNGFAEHVPMGAEALLTLGAPPERVLAWAGRHRPSDTPVASSTLLGEARRQAAASIEQAGWAPTLREWAGRLMPHLDAHLFHGLIRTAHVARALTEGMGPDAHGELATALAAWQVWATAHAGADEPAATGPDRAVILDAAGRGAAAFLAKPSIMTLHAVTAPMALLTLADLVDEDDLARGVGALLHSHRRHPARPSEPHTAPAVDLDRLLQQWDAHPAKLVEAAVRAHRATGDPVFAAVVGAMLEG